MRREIDEGVAELAATRAGVFTRDDVAALGGDRRLVARRIAAGAWVDRGHRTLSLRSHAHSFDQRRWIALAAAGPSHLSHESAAELHRLTAVLRGLIVISVPHPRHLERSGTTYHQVGDIAAHHLTEVDGFPTTTPARTIVDLATVLRPIRLEHALEDVIVRRLSTFSQIAGVLGDVRRRGKPGVAKLIDVLARRAGRPVPDSKLEAMLHEKAHRARVPTVAQAPLPARPLLDGLVDLAVLESKLILEADGREWHARERAMARDRQRDREAARQGWLTLRFVHDDLTHDLDECADDIRATHLARCATASKPP